MKKNISVCLVLSALLSVTFAQSWDAGGRRDDYGIGRHNEYSIDRYSDDYDRGYGYDDYYDSDDYYYGRNDDRRDNYRRNQLDRANRQVESSRKDLRRAKKSYNNQNDIDRAQRRYDRARDRLDRVDYGY